MDVDSIAPGADFDQRITNTLGVCDVTLVLIGSDWLDARLPDGTRRLEDRDDFVRREIALALAAQRGAVVPVLVEGARMPNASELPDEIAALSKRQAFELSNKRWQFDMGQLSKLVLRYDHWWWRLLRGMPTPVRRGAPVLAVAIVVAVALLLATGSGTNRRGALFPQTTGPVVDECKAKLFFAVDGTAGPLTCGPNTINSIAWEYYEHFNPSIMTLGRFATIGQVINAICLDSRNQQMTDPKVTQAYRLAQIYNGWRFAVQPDPATSC
jgi:hypothetical protein